VPGRIDRGTGRAVGLHAGLFDGLTAVAVDTDPRGHQVVAGVAADLRFGPAHRGRAEAGTGGNETGPVATVLIESAVVRTTDNGVVAVAVLGAVVHVVDLGVRWYGKTDQ